MTKIKFESFAENVENYLYIDTLDEKMENGGRKGLYKTAQLVQKLTKKRIKSPPKTGRKYPNLPHRSSRGGEYPAYQTGKLYSSIKHMIKGNKRVFIGSTKNYARFLAFGTRNMEKRAFIGNVIKENIEKGYDIISNEINKELNK